MDNKTRLIKLIEEYLNGIKGHLVFEFYGEGSSIKINRVDFGITKNYVSIDAKILLGEIITEGILAESLARILIEDSMVFFFPNSQIRTCITFDV
jgi:hypothetical protein